MIGTLAVHEGKESRGLGELIELPRKKVLYPRVQNLPN